MCSVENCEKPKHARGMCPMHYQRNRLTGSVKSPAPGDRERFLSHTRIEGSCITWTGNLYAQGYGRFCANSKQYRAHRYSYEMFVGPIAKGNVVHHMCRNRACVNPAHLESVTQAANVAEALDYRNVHRGNIEALPFAASFYVEALTDLVK